MYTKSTIRPQGFTLLELLMVLAIIVILLSVAVPSMISFISSNRIAGVADLIKSEIEWARTEAVKDNQDVTISFTPGTNWCIGVDDDPSGGACACSSNNCRVNGQIKVISHADYNEISLAANLTNNKIEVDTTGIALQTGDITITNGTHSATLNLSRLGRASICSNSISKFPQC